MSTPKTQSSINTPEVDTSRHIPDNVRSLRCDVKDEHSFTNLADAEGYEEEEANYSECKDDQQSQTNDDEASQRDNMDIQQNDSTSLTLETPEIPTMQHASSSADPPCLGETHTDFLPRVFSRQALNLPPPSTVSDSSSLEVIHLQDFDQRHDDSSPQPAPPQEHPPRRVQLPDQIKDLRRMYWFVGFSLMLYSFCGFMIVGVHLGTRPEMIRENTQHMMDITFTLMALLSTMVFSFSLTWLFAW